MEFFEHLEGVWSKKLALMSGIWTLLKLETKLAGITVYSLITCIGFLIVFALTSWLLLITLLTYTLLIITGHFYMSLGLVFLLNACCLLFSLKRLTANLQNMSFVKTRACLANNHWNQTHVRDEATTSVN